MLIAQRPVLSEETVADNRSRFVIEPLGAGFGYTLGNSLRRTLLSSIPGAAVTSIRVDGVLHEFQTIPGSGRISSRSSSTSSASSSHRSTTSRSSCTCAAGASVPSPPADIAPPAGVEVHNPDLHIATLNDKARLEMEFTVERGRGYVSAQQNKDADAEIGRIPVDSICSPVLAVTYKVEATRVEAAHRLRPPHRRRRDQVLDEPARRGRLGRQDARRALRPGP